MKRRVHHAGLTDKGCVREENEDAWSADPKLGLYIVSDGLGGEFAGALASKIVVETLPRLVRQQLAGIEDVADPKATKHLVEAIARLSLEMRRDTKGKPALEGMGATVVLALIRGTKALVAHMGDSRAYLWRQGALKAVTKDHSIVQLLLDQGEISPEQVADHPSRARVTRFVGMFDEPLPEARALEVQPGDRLLLCTDGLTGMLSDAKILRLLNEHMEPKEACQRLVDGVNEAGGKDNVTVMVLAVEGTDGQPKTKSARAVKAASQLGGKANWKKTAKRPE